MSQVRFNCSWIWLYLIAFATLFIATSASNIQPCIISKADRNDPNLSKWLQQNKGYHQVNFESSGDSKEMWVGTARNQLDRFTLFNWPKDQSNPAEFMILSKVPDRDVLRLYSLYINESPGHPETVIRILLADNQKCGGVVTGEFLPLLKGIKKVEMIGLNGLS